MTKAEQSGGTAVPPDFSALFRLILFMILAALTVTDFQLIFICQKELEFFTALYYNVKESLESLYFFYYYNRFAGKACNLLFL